LLGGGLARGKENCKSLHGTPGQVGYAPNERTKSVVPHLRRSTSCLWTQPFRAGLIFGAGPLGLDCKHRVPMFIPPLLSAGKPAAREDKGERGFSTWDWLQGSQVSKARPGAPFDYCQGSFSPPSKKRQVRCCFSLPSPSCALTRNWQTTPRCSRSLRRGLRR
jgi:hypothetical protein